MRGKRFEAFFLPAEPGARFALFHPPHGSVAQGGVLYVHPFAEEMNKSRRMAALQARAFAAIGFAVLQIDLYGCGDSSGNFGHAAWEIWRRDLMLAATWLKERVAGPLHLWGLRLGAMLALDVWRDQPSQFSSALLWQPVLNGETFMTQFLRLLVAGDAIRDGGTRLSTETLRQRLHVGETIEVGGYPLSPALVSAIDRLNPSEWTIPGALLHWLEVKNGTASGPSPAVQKMLSKWQGNGMRAEYGIVAGDPFWTTQEISEVPELIAATLARYGKLLL